MSSIMVIGAGPGIGSSVAHRCSGPGDTVGLVARSRETLEPLAADLRSGGRVVTQATADVADELGLRVALGRLLDAGGPPTLVVYNAGLIQADRPGALSHEQHRRAWSVNVVGAVTTAALLCPVMADAGGGTFIITGGMPRPVPELTSLSLGKAGVRALAELLDKEYGDAGVHVATVTVAGTVRPGSPYDPDAIADVYRRLHEQQRASWEREVHFEGLSGGSTPAGSAA